MKHNPAHGSLRGPEGVIVVSQLPPPMHGSTLMTQKLIETLQVAGYNVQLVERTFSRSASEIGKFRVRKLFSAFSLVIRLFKAARKSPNYPVIFFCTNRPFSFLVDCVMSALLRSLAMKRINYVHTSGYRDLASKGPVWRLLVKLLLGDAAVTVCLSDELTKDVAPWAGTTAIHVIPNTVNSPAEFVPNTTKSRVNIVYLSNLIPSKGAAEFVTVAQRLLSESEEWDFLIAGAATDDGYLDSLNAEIALCRPGGRVSYLGALEPEEKWHFLQDADILVFPSSYKYEAQPLVLIEAMAVGTAVVAYDIGGVSSIISDDSVGCLVPVDDIDALVSATRRLASDVKLRRAIRGGARTRFEQYFSQAAFQSSWRKVLARQDYPQKNGIETR